MQAKELKKGDAFCIIDEKYKNLRNNKYRANYDFSCARLHNIPMKNGKIQVISGETEVELLKEYE